MARKSAGNDPGHYWDTTLFDAREGLGGSGPAWPLYIMFWAYLIFWTLSRFSDEWCLKKLFSDCIAGCFGSSSLDEIDEAIDRYHKVLDDEDRQWSIEEEEYCRDKFGLDAMYETTLKKLKYSKLGKCHLQGNHCYDILNSPYYAQRFQYFSPSNPGRNHIIKDGINKPHDKSYQSDLVRYALNLAFVKEDDVRKIGKPKQEGGICFTYEDNNPRDKKDRSNEDIDHEQQRGGKPQQHETLSSNQRPNYSIN